MKKIFITFLFLIFSSAFSQANNNEKITVQEIENIFFGNHKGGIEFEKFSIDKWLNQLPKNEYEKTKIIGLREYESDLDYQEILKLEERGKRRPEIKGFAKCLYKDGFLNQLEKNCSAKIIKRVFTKSEMGKKRRPGDIFYLLDAVTVLSLHWDEWNKFFKTFLFYEGDKPKKGMRCKHKIHYTQSDDKYWMVCMIFKRPFNKKIEKFRKNPTDEKVLGKQLIDFIKRFRMVKDFEKKLGTDNYALIGDMLNYSVSNVKKNNISRDLRKRRILLKKYSLILDNIKKKLDEEKYKSIDKDLSSLSKTYENLNTLKTTSDEVVINIDKAVNIIFETNKFIQKSTLKAKNNEKERSYALASIKFMQSLVDSILYIVPEQYYAETKLLDKNYFNNGELDQLDNILKTIVRENKRIKFEKLKNSMNIIDSFLNPSLVVKKLSNLGISNIANKPLTQNTLPLIASLKIKDNIDKDLFKSAKKILDDLDKKELDNLTKEAAQLTKEISKEISKKVSSEKSIKKVTTSSYPDPKFGGQSLKRLIAASRR